MGDLLQHSVFTLHGSYDLLFGRFHLSLIFWKEGMQCLVRMSHALKELPGFRFCILWLLVHSMALSAAVCMLLSSPDLLQDFHIVVSSTYVSLSQMVFKSFICSKKDVVPSKVPWGTPAVSGLLFDVFDPILIHCCLSYRKFVTQLIRKSCTPVLASFDISTSTAVLVYQAAFKCHSEP